MNMLSDKYFKTVFLVGEVLHRSLLQLLLEHCDFLNIDISQGSVAIRLSFENWATAQCYILYTNQVYWKTDFQNILRRS